MTTFFDLEASFAFYTKSMEKRNSGNPVCSEAKLQQTIDSIRIKMVFYFIVLLLFFIGLLLLYENFLKQNMVYAMLYMVLISLIYMTFAIKLMCCYFRIYNSFKKSFDDKLHSETKQILCYIAMFAGVFTLASINFITFVSGHA